MKETCVIDIPKKIKLYTWAGTSESSIDDSKPPHEIQFIYGIGSGGLSNFEYLIAGKSIGDEIVFKFNRSDFQDMFAHLGCHFQPDINHFHGDDHWIKVKVVTVTSADNREIVKAMAGGGGCGGGGCECGCGC